MKSTNPIRRPIHRKSRNHPTTIVSAGPRISTEEALSALKKHQKDKKAAKKAKKKKPQ